MIRFCSILAVIIILFTAAYADALEVPKKVDIELGQKLVAIARGYPKDLPEPPLKEHGESFLIYQLLGKYEGTAGWYAVNAWTGDVWNMGCNCTLLSNPALRKAQVAIKSQFNGNEIKEYDRLHALRPFRMCDLEPCGSAQ